MTTDSSTGDWTPERIREARERCERTFPRVTLGSVAPGSLIENAGGFIALVLAQEGRKHRRLLWVDTGMIGDMHEGATVSLRATPAELDALTSADASRPGLTEEQAPTPAEMLAACTEEGFGGFGQGFVTGVLAERARLRWLPVVTENQPYIADGKTGNPTEEPCDPESCHGCANEALLRASRGETGPAPPWGEQAIAEHRRAAEPEPFEKIEQLPTLGPGIIAPPRYFRVACVDLVRAADASRPGLTEEQIETLAKSFDAKAEAEMVLSRKNREEPAEWRHEAVSVAWDEAAALLRASRGETGPAHPLEWTCPKCGQRAVGLGARQSPELGCERCGHVERPAADLGPGIGGAPIRVRPTAAPDPLALDPEDGTLCADCKTPRNTIHGALCSLRWGKDPGRVPDPRATLHAGDPASVPDPRVDYSDSMRPAVLGGECAECLHAPPLHERTCSKVARRPQ